MKKPAYTFYTTHEAKFNLKGSLMLLLGAVAVTDITTEVDPDGEVIYSTGITHVKFKRT